MSWSRPQDVVEKALAASKADGQITFVVESSEANLRWASNSLTTNGAMRSRQVVVVSFVDGGAGMAAGTVTRSGAPDVGELVAASEQAARDAGPAEDAMPLISEQPPGAGDWDADPAETSIEVFREFAPALGEAFGDARDRGDLLFGFAEHSMATTYLGSSTGLRLRHDQPTGRVELNGKNADFGRSVCAARRRLGCPRMRPVVHCSAAGPRGGRPPPRPAGGAGPWARPPPSARPWGPPGLPAPSVPALSPRGRPLLFPMFLFHH